MKRAKMGAVRAVSWLLLSAWVLRPSGLSAADEEINRQPGIERRHFIYESAPFPSCHASTLVEMGGEILAAWFGGLYEKHRDVAIYTARYSNGVWSKPVEVANGVDGEQRFPTWNPVLFQGSEGPLMLFYKVGPSPDTWWGMVMTSTDGGKTWSKGKRLPPEMLGPVRNKPIELPDGSILCGSSTENAGWRVHMERTWGAGGRWERTGALNLASEFGAIQPTVLRWPNGRLQILNRSRQGVVTECWSEGAWDKWSPMVRTQLPNPNSGIDAVMLKDGRALLVYNHVGKGRSPLNLAFSKDGKVWQAGPVLETEPGEYSYPAVIATKDGRAHVLYTWKRERMRHVVVDPSMVELKPLESVVR